MELTALFNWLRGNLRLLGVLAIAICVATWIIDLAGWVHECPFCRVQRTAIGIVGILMILPDPRIWWLRYGAGVICFFGAHVAAAQMFLVIRNMMSGQLSNPVNLILATGALFILIGQATLVFTDKPD